MSQDHHPALLNLADMIGPVSHELRNVFNNMVLHAAILGRAAPEELRSQVAQFRALAMRADEMLSILDQYRQKIVIDRKPFDVNQAVEEAVCRCQAKGIVVEKQLTVGLSLIEGDQADAARLVELVVCTCQAPVHVRTDRTGGGVQVTVRGGQPTVETAEGFWEPFGPPGSGQFRLDRAACLTIARRLGASLRAESQENGLAVLVLFKPVSAG